MQNKAKHAADSITDTEAAAIRRVNDLENEEDSLDGLDQLGRHAAAAPKLAPDFGIEDAGPTFDRFE